MDNDPGQYMDDFREQVRAQVGELNELQEAVTEIKGRRGRKIPRGKKRTTNRKRNKTARASRKRNR